MEKDTKRQLAVSMLVEKSRERGEGYLPKKTDFTNEEACFIKQKLGPWPRALEEAGLKERTRPDSKELSRLKRERLKRKEKKAKSGNTDREDKKKG